MADQRFVPINKRWHEAFRSGRSNALGLIDQLLDKMIPAQRLVPEKPKNAAIRLLRRR
jgi:hypothetical protein